MAEALHSRIQSSRGVVGLYYDATGVFRISPTTGIRYKKIEQAFPDSIVGVYTNKVNFDAFYEDFEFFCQLMGN